MLVVYEQNLCDPGDEPAVRKTVEHVGREMHVGSDTLSLNWGPVLVAHVTVCRLPGTSGLGFISRGGCG